MQAFKLFIEVYDPIKYRACATSSLREATNGLEILRQIREQTGLKMELISGREEAALIYSNHIEDLLDHKQSYLYIDVGGGSTEVTLFDKGKIIFSRSFEIGTLRLLNDKVKKESWTSMKSWVRENTVGHSPITAIGSGGNINRIFKILGRKDKPLSFSKLKELYYLMKPLTLEDRMEIWDLNPDRADVIVPAAKIFLTLMKVAGIDNIVVPQIGLVDGVIHKLHEENSGSI
jgi:exopolyphosphatase/guanosine-5'-triphosphate,3'-diphosphate pyrophosphatase